jgi:hypothetical protein
MEPSVQLYVPAALPPRYPRYGRLGGPQSRPERSGDEKNLCLCQESKSGSPACCVVAVDTELPRCIELNSVGL